MKQDVYTHVRSCDVCQKCKNETVTYPGLLQPLPIPDKVWQDISMDFIEGLPKAVGKEVIFEIVDRLSKDAHFIALKHPYTTLDVAQMFMDQVFRLHGMPKSIVSDRDVVFTSKFWKELFRLQKVSLLTLIAYHPQTDGQTEEVNRCVKTYLRCFCSDSQKVWMHYLGAVEWWYNTTFHSSIQCTPYESLYGQHPPLHLPYAAGDSSMEEVDRSLLTREFKVQLLKYHLKTAQ